MEDTEIVYESSIEDQIGAIFKRMDEIPTDSKEFSDLAKISVEMAKVHNEQTRIENEAEAKREEREQEKQRIENERKRIKNEKKQKEKERKLKEQELKDQRKIAWITGGLGVLVASITAAAGIYSTRQNRRNLEDTLEFEKTGIVRSAGHKHVNKKG